MKTPRPCVVRLVCAPTTVACGLLLIASIVSAQTTAPSTSRPARTTGESAEEVVSLEEYVVQQKREAGYRATTTTSANRINMSIKDVPMNIPVLTEDFIKDVGASGQREALQWLAGVDDRRVRGFNTVDFLSNGFQRSSDFSAANIDRIEILRGPSAVLDGVTSPGGVINVITKKPILDRQFLRTTFRYGSPTEMFYGAADANISVGPKLDHGHLVTARVIGSYHYALSGVRGPLQTLLVRYGEDEEAMINPSILIRPTRNTTVTLEYEYWNHKYGVQDEQNTAFRLTVPGATFATGEIPLAIALNIPPERSWTGPDLRNYQLVSNVFASVDHKFTPTLSANLAFNNHLRDNPFQAEPRIRTAIVGGQTVILREWRKNERDNKNRSVRGNLFYAFDAGATKHRAVAGFQHLKFESSAPFHMATVLGTASTNYADIFNPLEPLPDLRLDESRFYWRFLRHDRSATENTSYFLNHQGRWLNERLISLVGVYNSKAERTLGAPNKSDKLLPQAGFVYFFRPESNVFINWARSMQPNLTVQDGSGNPLDPTFGEVMEAGVKVAILGSRLFATASVYEIKEQDKVQFDPLAPNRDNPTADPTRPRGANISVGEITSRGFDLDTYLYPVRNWSVIATYSYNDVFISKDIAPALVDRQVNATFNHKWTLWNKYEFAEGPAKGLYFGGGVQRRGEKLRSYRNNAAGVPLPAFQKPMTRVDLLLGHKGKAFGVPYQISVNAKNLTRSESVSSGNAAVFGFKPGSNEGYYFKPKPEYVFTAEFTF